MFLNKYIICFLILITITNMVSPVVVLYSINGCKGYINDCPVDIWEDLKKSPFHHRPPLEAPSSPDCPSQPEQEPGGGHQQQQGLLPPVQGRGVSPGEGQGAGQEEEPHCGHRLPHCAGGQEGQSSLTDPSRAPKRGQISLINS